MFEDAIIQNIIDSWDKVPGAKRTLREPVPDFKHVKLLMESVFWASVKKEEDRAIQISVSLLCPESIRPETQAQGNFTVSFQRRIPFTEQALVKLASAFDPFTTSLAVCPGGDSSESLHIWGIIHVSKRARNRLDYVSGACPPPDGLTISTMSPGSLLISRAGEIIARFTSRGFIYPMPTPFASKYLMRYFLKTVETLDGYRQIGMTYWHYYRDFLRYVLVKASNRGHGGTIVWLPQQVIPEAKRFIELRHILSDSPTGSQLLADAIDESVGRDHVKQMLLLMAKKGLAEYAEFLAQLTCVDGALVLSDSLEVLSFGSRLTAPSWKGEAISPTDRSENEFDPVDLSKYGMRHNSAVDFVGKCPGSFAFVISQDGPIAGLTRFDDSNIFWWPDCLSSLWVE